MKFIPIKKEIKKINGSQMEVFVVSALCFKQKNGSASKKIPHPLGEDYIVFKSLEEAQEAIAMSGFSCILPDGKKALQKETHNVDYHGLILDSLTKLTKDTHSNVVASAVFSLGEIAHIDSIDVLTEKLAEENEVIRNNAIDALVKIGNRSTSKLIKILDDQNWIKKNSAIICLGKMAEIGLIDLEPAIVPLVEKLNDSNNVIKSSAAIALGKIYKNIKDEKNKQKIR